MNEEIKGSVEAAACGCEGENCAHQEETTQASVWTKHHGTEEIALAFLLALTPLTVLTFFGQVGLL